MQNYPVGKKLNILFDRCIVKVDEFYVYDLSNI